MHQSYHLILSGGGVRGLAHIGMYRALVEAGYRIARVSGTSAGALVGLCIAAGKSPDEIEEMFTEHSLFNFLKPAFSVRGLLSMSIIEKVITKYIPYTDLSDLPLPLRVCVCDIRTGEVLYYDTGAIAKLITASCAVPGIFKPVLYQGRQLVDGGLRDNLPLPDEKEVLPLIGCHVNPLPTKKLRTTKDIASKALEILINRDIARQAKQCDIFLEPPKLATVSQSPFVDQAKIITIGYDYAKEMLREL